MFVQSVVTIYTWCWWEWGFARTYVRTSSLCNGFKSRIDDQRIAIGWKSRVESFPLNVSQLGHVALLGTLLQHLLHRGELVYHVFHVSNFKRLRKSECRQRIHLQIRAPFHRNNSDNSSSSKKNIKLPFVTPFPNPCTFWYSPYSFGILKCVLLSSIILTVKYKNLCETDAQSTGAAEKEEVKFSLCLCGLDLMLDCNNRNKSLRSIVVCIYLVDTIVNKPENRFIYQKSGKRIVTICSYCTVPFEAVPSLRMQSREATLTTYFLYNSNQMTQCVDMHPNPLSRYK